MIEQAMIDFNINLSESIIVGDKEIDVLTGKNAGIGTSILVRSGHVVDEENTVADGVYNRLLDFAHHLKGNKSLYSKKD
jgi:D-glycero-D-manno-heptose 1,7-bisphosphate phosphatase